MSDAVCRKAISEGISHLKSINPELRGAYGIVEKMIESLPSIPSLADVFRRRIADQQRWGTPVSNEIVKELRAVWNELEALCPSGEQKEDGE
ncbi:hypothetical protein [Cohnella zeiphila]|uniref:Uncharacterized protein n=1 Tax=Cohnella zeiphila TaxID=2761120 RepID=A0A7X0SL29_9BACL|nr:hypothetical protein [Cohnella zeiphila]MBB6731911.1 hypothetical protein [Cohnella zeiphila]